MIAEKDIRIAVIGLGYVGLPLAVAFGKQLSTLGFDLSRKRIDQLTDGVDVTREVSSDELAAATQLTFSNDADDLNDRNIFVVAVPTPIDPSKRPDLGPLESASRTVGQAIRKGGIAIFESTVFPGATEEVCVPIIEAESGLRCNEDFFVGYSPERINPGDRKHRLETIIKVTSGSTPEAADFVDRLYAKVVPAGTHLASSIRVAEAAKVIENTQRDINIALVNELSKIFSLMSIDTQQVLAAAGTKWNFLNFTPGLVGGHCIGVDPYYLTHKAEQLGYYPEIILAGRRVNDTMAQYVAGELVKLLNRQGKAVSGAKILVLGMTFKEDCPDIRNTKVIDLIRALRDFGADVNVCDPLVDADEAREAFGLAPTAQAEAGVYDAVILAVAHKEFVSQGAKKLRAYGKPDAILYDLKAVFPIEETEGRL